jgi:hypothetical protein
MLLLSYIRALVTLNVFGVGGSLCRIVKCSVTWKGRSDWVKII